MRLGGGEARSPLRRAGGLVMALLMLALAACTGPAVLDRERLHTVAGGGTSGVYYGYGDALAQVLSEDLGAEVAVAETAGSVDNLLRISRGEALVGFTQSDAAADAIGGEGAFDQPLPIQAIARLYDEYLHVVVRADSGVRTLADLSGRPLSLGARDSGVAVVANRVLEAAGVTGVDDRELGLAASITALERGQIDGFFWVGGAPTPSVAQLAAHVPLRLLAIDDDVVEGLGRAHPGAYRFAELPVSAYTWAEPTATVAVPNYLVVAADAPAAQVRAVLETLFDSRSQLALRVPAAGLLDRRSAIFTDPIDLHPGAVEYYRESRG